MFSNWLSNTTNASRKQILKALRARAVSEIYMAKQYELYIPPTTANTVCDDMFKTTEHKSLIQCFIILSFHCFLSDLNVQESVSQCVSPANVVRPLSKKRKHCN